MTKLASKLALGAVTAFAVMGMSGGVAVADSQHAHHNLHTNLTELNKSGDSGTASVVIQKVDGKELTVKVNVTGASPGLPHAQHLHIGGENTCPVGQEFDKDKDGFLNTAEGQPAYGPVKVSLTTSGDVSDKSALAVDRFPTASADGTIEYERTFTLPEGVSVEDVTKAVVVSHGISEMFDDKAKYDGQAKSSLDDKLPLEATAPASCGAVTVAPTGGVGAGVGSSVNSTALIAAGGLSAAAAGMYVAARRFAKQS